MVAVTSKTRGKKGFALFAFLASFYTLYFVISCAGPLGGWTPWLHLLVTACHLKTSLLVPPPALCWLHKCFTTTRLLQLLVRRVATWVGFHSMYGHLGMTIPADHLKSVLVVYCTWCANSAHWRSGVGAFGLIFILLIRAIIIAVARVKLACFGA